MMSEYNISINKQPEASDLQRLFSQANWANDRVEVDIQKLIDNLNNFVCAYHDAALVGFARALSDGMYRALIEDVVVDIEHRGKGVGKLLVSSLMNLLRDVDQVYLNTGNDLEKFYGSLGFERHDGLTMVRHK